MSPRSFLVGAVAVAVAVLYGCSVEKPQTAPERVAEARPAPAPAPAAAATTVQPGVSQDALRADYYRALDLMRSTEADPQPRLEARSILMSILEKDRNYALAYVGLGQNEYYGAQVNSGTYHSEALDRAWKLIHHGLKIDPNLFEGHLAAAYVSLARGELDLARESLLRAQAIDAASPRLTLGWARLAERENDAPEMVRLAKEVLASSKDVNDLTRAHGVLITAYMNGGHADQADASYRAQIALDPRSPWSHGNYAWFLLDRGDVNGAIREAETAIAITPYPMARVVLLRALLARAAQEWDRNQIAEAGRTVERGAKLAGDDPRMQTLIGGFYEMAAVRAKDRSMRRQALEWYRKALAQQPDDRELQRAVQRMEER